VSEDGVHAAERHHGATTAPDLDMAFRGVLDHNPVHDRQVIGAIRVRFADRSENAAGDLVHQLGESNIAPVRMFALVTGALLARRVSRRRSWRMNEPPPPSIPGPCLDRRGGRGCAGDAGRSWRTMTLTDLNRYHDRLGD